MVINQHIRYNLLSKIKNKISFFWQFFYRFSNNVSPIDDSLNLDKLILDSIEPYAKKSCKAIILGSKKNVRCLLKKV